jgi:ATP-binding cassette, sub-family E, member 1
MKILAGIIKANLGEFDKEATEKDMINYFKGSQMQKYLEQLYKGHISLSYKPQQVEIVPKQFKGTMNQLLNKVSDNQEKIEQTTKDLDINHLLERDLSKLSGGELQRAVIAATVLKDATLLLFDEPSSYLDIKQRIKVSKYIQSLATKDKAVIAIEHDLIILDYMTDNLSIMYGHDSVYGIVSGLKNTREGVNSFLEGFLKEENVRFRSHPLHFQDAVEEIRLDQVEVITWNDLTAELGGFKFQAKDGALQSNEIIGVLGENGIGKTSFIKILAKQIKNSQETKITGKFTTTDQVNVAYKPQYLDYSTNDTLVQIFLQKAIEKYNNQLIKPLDLEKLFTKKVKELSGGELQRTVIAKTLAEDATVFLLDEPSAYLDVEQRLIVSKVIKRMANEKELTVLVVDHDLMFIDNIADKLLVFTGKPGIQGTAQGPFKKPKGMNLFLKELDITLRRDPTSKRPRINKAGSVKDREQRTKNQWYYS